MISKIVKAEFTMLIGEIKQYYLNYIFYNLSILVLYFGLFYNFFSSDAKENILAMLISLVLWQICSNAIQYLSYLIQDEAMMGTLEQMFLTRTSFITILLTKILVNMIFVLVKGLIMFVLCTIIFGQISILSNLDIFECLLIIFICVITTFTFYCIGGIFGGLSLYFKRISSLLNVFDYFLLLFTGIVNSIYNYPPIFYLALNLIPITQANSIIKSICTNSFIWSSLFNFVLLSIIYIIVSYKCLTMLIDTAKMKGKLGQY
ncbi:MAG: hypothetical protein WBO70_01865 [Erysipelotrichaceae bacterium]